MLRHPQTILFSEIRNYLSFLRFYHSDVANQSLLSIQYFSACFFIYFCIGLSFTLFLQSLFFCIFKKFISPEWIISVPWNEIVLAFSPSACAVCQEMNIFTFWLWSFPNIFPQPFLFPSCLSGSVSWKFFRTYSLPIF